MAQLFRLSDSLPAQPTAVSSRSWKRHGLRCVCPRVRLHPATRFLGGPRSLPGGASSGPLHSVRNGSVPGAVALGGYWQVRGSATLGACPEMAVSVGCRGVYRSLAAADSVRTGCTLCSARGPLGAQAFGGIALVAYWQPLKSLYSAGGPDFDGCAPPCARSPALTARRWVRPLRRVSGCVPPRSREAFGSVRVTSGGWVRRRSSGSMRSTVLTGVALDAAAQGGSGRRWPRRSPGRDAAGSRSPRCGWWPSGSVPGSTVTAVPVLDTRSVAQMITS